MRSEDDDNQSPSQAQPLKNVSSQVQSQQYEQPTQQRDLFTQDVFSELASMMTIDINPTFMMSP